MDFGGYVFGAVTGELRMSDMFGTMALVSFPPSIFGRAGVLQGLNDPYEMHRVKNEHLHKWQWKIVDAAIHANVLHST